MGADVIQRLLLVGIMLVFSLAYARAISAAGATTTDKGPATISVSYVSVFSTYMFYQDQPVTSWREANDLTGKIGGWRFYAREGKQPDSAGALPEPKADVEQPVAPPVTSDQHPNHGNKP